MDSLPAPCPGDHWPRGCGDGSPAAPTPGRCASCCPPARRRRWRRGRWRCAATPRPSSTPRHSAWRRWSPPSGVAAGGTRRSPISLRGLEAAGHRTSVWVLDDEGRHASGEPGRDRGALPRVLRAARGPGARRLRGLGGRRRGHGHRLADRRAGPAAAGRERPRLPRAGPRARVLPDVGRARSGPRGPTGRAFTASPPRRGWPTSCARATAPARRASTSAIDHGATGPSTSNAARTACSSTRAP